jgi:3-phosphoshikimate 1-carboxyvinyltransferase
MPTLRIDKGGILPSVTIPSSKSYANRALILASLNKSPVTIENLPEAEDVVHLISALKDIGLEVEQSGEEVIIRNSFPECEKGDREIEVGEGGTTARFLATMLLLGKKKYFLKLGQRLKARPWQEFLEITKKLGAFAELKDDVLTVQGPLTAPSALEVDCSRTTQFATGLDLILGRSKVIPKNLESSQSYWAMNAPMIEHFQKHNHYRVPADWSSAAFPMVFAALNHKVHFPGLTEDPFQADSKLTGVLQNLDSLEANKIGMTVSPVTKRQNVKLDMSDCLDLFPAMTFLVSHVEGKHELTGLANLAHKESDRMKEMEKLLSAFERKYQSTEKSITIEGSNKICGPKDLHLPDDHRIVMAAALFLRHHSGGSLDHAESVNKSYPGFFEIFH